MSTELSYNISVDDEGVGSVTYVKDGAMVTVPSTNLAFARVVACLIDGIDPSEVASLDSIIADMADDRITYVNGAVYWKGEQVHNHLTDVIQRYAAEGRDNANLVKFMERLYANPSERSREELFTWTESQRLTIDPDGFIIGWKSVNSQVDDEYDENGELKKVNKLVSVHAGTASVNGVEVTGHIPNDVGVVVSMPREAVDDNHRRDCSTGLHVGSYGYASTFTGNVLLEVKIDPADVVSVPTYDTNKLRCCRYEVLAIHAKQGANLSHYEPTATFGPDTAVEKLADANVPRSFLARLKTRLGW